MENKSFNVGGSIEQATNGKTELNAISILRETTKLTNKTLLSYMPSIAIYLVVQLLLVVLFIEVRVGNAVGEFGALFTGSEFSPELLHNLMLAGQFADVVSAPVYLAVSLMAINHSVGLPTSAAVIWRSVPKMVTLSISTMMLTVLLQTVGTMLFFPLGMFLTMAMGFVLLLICIKRVPLAKAIQYSVVASFRHIGQLTLLFAVIMMMFWLATMTFGLGLLVVLPFFFNMKALVFRTLFGITLQAGGSDSDQESQPQPKTMVFDA